MARLKAELVHSSLPIILYTWLYVYIYVYCIHSSISDKSLVFSFYFCGYFCRLVMINCIKVNISPVRIAYSHFCVTLME